jgi:DNA-binding GntR family transcriptional regulator
MSMGHIAARHLPLVDSVRVAGARLHAELRSDIITGRMRPGESLSEARVAEQYGISRTPVREVFRRLTDEGLLRVVPQVGTYVAPINLAAVSDSQFIREALECHAVRHAADRITALQVRALQRQLTEQARRVAASDHAGFFTLDERMHQTIATIAGHAAVWDLIASVKAQLDRVRHLSLEDDDWLTMIFHQHGDIVARLGAHDAAGAEHAMQRHLRTAFAAIDRIATRHADFFETAPHPRREVA